jgi:transposase
LLQTGLRAAPRVVTGDAGIVEAHVTHALIAVLATLVTQIKALANRSPSSSRSMSMVTPSPACRARAGVRAARLLAEIGDCRARFPTPEALICLAGVAPSTRQSGRTRVVTFRWACNKQLCDAVTDFAGDFRHANPWATDLYRRARARGHDHPHAVRILARGWLYVI